MKCRKTCSCTFFLVGMSSVCVYVLNLVCMCVCLCVACVQQKRRNQSTMYSPSTRSMALLHRNGCCMLLKGPFCLGTCTSPSDHSSSSRHTRSSTSRPLRLLKNPLSRWISTHRCRTTARCSGSTHSVPIMNNGQSRNLLTQLVMPIWDMW